MRRYILVVDDDPAVRMILTDLLEDAGFAVRSAANTLDALEFCHRRMPALLITGLNIPGRSGARLVRELDASGLPPFPVLVLSPREDLGLPEEPADRPMERVPMHLDRLLAKVRVLVPPEDPTTEPHPT